MLLEIFATATFLQGMTALVLENAVPKETTGHVNLVLVRHGQAQNNVFPHQRFFGEADPSLTEEGKRQTVQASLLMGAMQPINLVFASCLVRAQETALLLFPNQSVIHVAPYISELNWNHPWSQPASMPHSRNEQILDLQQDLDYAASSSRISYEGAPPQTRCGPPNWSKFLDWLWSRPEVQSLVSNATAKLPPGIAVVSHGLFLKTMLKHEGWNVGHLRNVQVISAKLHFQHCENDAPCGFGGLIVKKTFFGGFADTQAKDWVLSVTLTAAVISVVALGVWKFCHRS